jgi:hypothetical protein
LQASPDPGVVRTAAEFKKRAQVFHMTYEGEAAEQAFAFLEPAARYCAEPQGTTAFVDIEHALRELEQLSREPVLDPGRVHRNLVVLNARFEDLTSSAQSLISMLERANGASVAEMRRFIDYAERFAGELVMAGDRIRETVRDIEQKGVERLFQAAAEYIVHDGLDTTPGAVTAVCTRWRSHWHFFCEWFISQPVRVSSAELLRERIRTAIPPLLRVIATNNDRQVYRVDRSNDFRVLARWFAEAESEAEAHRLWRALFGLCPARHLVVNDATLNDSAWRPALTRIVDRTAEKHKLAAAVLEESVHTLNARARLGTGRRMRLSEIACLGTAEFGLLLDLLAEALSIRVFSTEPVEIVSGDGCLKVKLEPSEDGGEALVVTPDGVFCGPDHWITVERIFAHEVLA